ncbi:MAG: lactate utilization protein [Holophagales bacterium]|nr:lactate utilization protein [Holophagales bacterium]
MFDTFRARAEAVSAEVHRVGGSAETLLFVEELLRREGVVDTPGARAVWAAGPLVTRANDSGLASRVPGLTFDVTREAAAASRVGISEMEWGLADTGTVVQDATDPALRLVSTLPEIHVALLPASRILPGLADVLPRLDPGRVPYIAFVTGPSRTADIERVLTIGVHGPSRLVVVVHDGDEAGPELKAELKAEVAP